ncbi:MAG: carboxypeptidase-like regulatory domain-containing protein [Thermoanaerobaculia bacterium]
MIRFDSRLRIVVLAVGAFAAACVTGRNEVAATAQTAPEPTGNCANRLVETMDEGDHLVDDLALQQDIRTLKGVLRSAAGSWPDVVRPSLEVLPLRAPASDWTLRIIADSEGRFSGPFVPDGEYCVKASAPGWRTVIGKVHVTTKARSSAELDVLLELGI